MFQLFIANCRSIARIVAFFAIINVDKLIRALWILLRAEVFGACLAMRAVARKAAASNLAEGASVPEDALQAQLVIATMGCIHMLVKQRLPRKTT
jgi:hypothetical protein